MGRGHRAAAGAGAGIGAAIGVAAGVAVTGLFLWDQYREAQLQARRRELLARSVSGSGSGPSDEQLSANVKEYMQLSLENMMILFKREQPDASFEEFIAARFPENSFVGPDGRLTCDDRVRCPSWEGAYHRVHPADRLHKVEGGPPGGRVA